MEQTVSKLRRWELDHPEQDIRGWPLRDATGGHIGTVSELRFDDRTGHVTHVVLADGRRYSAHDIYMGDRFLAFAKETPKEERAAERSGNGSATAATAAAAGTLGGAAKKMFPEKVTNGGADVVVSLIDEELEISKRSFDAGGAQVQTRVVEQPVARELRLMDERVKVERRNVDRPLQSAEADAEFKDRTIEVTAKSEVPIVHKRAHVTEEIVLKKELSQRVERIKDSVRHTDVDIQELAAAKRSEGN
jgi:uncharacterized protein (TIGR02271 family)